MRSLHGAALALAVAMSTAGVGGFFAAGCGGGGGGGESADAASDAMGDGTVTDTGPGADGSSVETGVDASDASPDTMVQPEAGNDAPIDGPDEGSVVTDAGTLALAFAHAETNAWCEAIIANCPNGATYIPACESHNGNFGVGWESTQPSYSEQAAYGRGNLAYSPGKAAACIAAIKALPANTQNPKDWQTVTTACEGVITGTLPAGQGCISSFECAPGNYCNDKGTCAKLAGMGNSCLRRTDAGVVVSPSGAVNDQPCSYLGMGSDTNLFCNLFDAIDAGSYGTCQFRLDAGTPCFDPFTTSYYDDQACAPPSLCGDKGCATAAHYPYLGACKSYKDASAD